MIIYVPCIATPGDYVKNIYTGEIKRVERVENEGLAKVDEDPFYDYTGWWNRNDYLVLFEIYEYPTPLESVPKIKKLLQLQE
ncbi:hypothetical protein P9D43_20935 [Neobacillus niacini]|uniref:hypothetical protein n=1 Tax=Neobacillus niacini TaxID=86668 RepID=UPI0007AB5458|nr:hypothetical protein [Neobacillus niacini]MEC1524472.1 hypothetical protein [Neobacillus niacini]